MRMKRRQPRKIAIQPFGGTSKQHFRLTLLGVCRSVGECWKPVGESPPFGPYPTPAQRPCGTGLRHRGIQKHLDSSAQWMKLGRCLNYKARKRHDEPLRISDFWNILPDAACCPASDKQMIGGI